MKKIIILLSFIFLFSLSCVVFAKEETTCPKDSVCLDNPLGSGTTVQTLIGKVIKSVLGVVGSLALLMFIYGGFTWMTAAGASDKVTKGRDTLVWAVLGLSNSGNALLDVLVKSRLTGENRCPGVL